MRPGCDRPAAARVAFDPVGLQLWLDPLSRRSAPVQELCEFHVERLTIPRGWSATDRRPGASAADPVAAPLTVVESVAPQPEPEPEPVAVEPEPEPEPEPVVVELEPVVVEPEPAVVEPEPEPEPVAVTPEPVDVAVAPAVEAEPENESVVAEPAPDVEPDVEPEPVAASERRPARRSRSRSSKSAAPSLLSRAFELTGHQESILTRGSSDTDAEPGQD